jgi:hypothetical protein
MTCCMVIVDMVGFSRSSIAPRTDHAYAVSSDLYALNQADFHTPVRSLLCSPVKSAAMRLA